MEKLKEKILPGKDRDGDGNRDEGRGPGQQNVLAAGADEQRQQQQGNAAAVATRSRTKRGLCWPVENKQDDPSRFTRPGSQVSWYYNWAPHPTQRGTAGLQYVPMQWDAGGIQELAGNVQRVGARTVLGFNEPELAEQANLTVDAAADRWMEFFEPLRRSGVRCGSPAITNAGHSVQWLQNFLRDVRGRGGNVDFCCLHWYGTEVGGFFDWIWSTRQQIDPALPYWITEFACTNFNEQNPVPREQVQKFATESFAYLDTVDWVERYCWFAPTRNIGNVGVWARMYNDEGNLTELGRNFRGD